MSTLAHSPAEITKWTLVAQGVGSQVTGGGPWPIASTNEMSTPDNTITTYDTAGQSDGRSMVDGVIDQHYGVQVRVRAQDFLTGWQKAMAIRDAMATGTYDELITIGSNIYDVLCFSKISQVLPLGDDKPNTRRKLFTINALLSVLQIA